MSWAGRKRAAVVIVIGAIIIAALAIFGFSLFYETPTCFDRKQNQGEVGVDCGGSCSTLCSSQVDASARVVFTRAFSPQPDRTDVIAYVENPNADAQAKDAPFSLELYGTEGQPLARITLTLDLPPSSTVPIYVADVASRGVVVARAFLTPENAVGMWSRAGEQLPNPEVTEIKVTEGDRPRVTATLRNPLAVARYDLTYVATIFDATGTAIAASQTLIPRLPSQGTAPLVFTWKASFFAPVAKVEVLPVPSLPSAR